MSRSVLQQRLPTGERVSEGSTVDVFELAADGDAVGDTRRPHAPRAGDLGEKMRGRLALDRGIRRENQLSHRTLIE